MRPNRVLNLGGGTIAIPYGRNCSICAEHGQVFAVGHASADRGGNLKSKALSVGYCVRTVTTARLRV